MLIWLDGLLRHRGARLLATAAGIGTAVALLATLGAFLSRAQQSMTARAVATVGVDWQVHLDVNADPKTVLDLVRAEPGVRTALPVAYVRVPALAATIRGSVSTTGAAVVVGLPDGYRDRFPGQIRDLGGGPGDGKGVLLAQQTAANLRAVPGTVITVQRPGLTPAEVTVTGVVDLPHADTMFAGTTPGTAVAPPDNVLLLPDTTFAEMFTPLRAVRADLFTDEVHARTDRRLPADPGRAYTATGGAARHLDADLAGAGHTTDNLGAALDAARADAAYATALFLFLATPGAVLAGLLTAVIVATASRRRQREQALLRTRGATTRQVLTFAAVESAVCGVLGAGFGVAVAAALGAAVFGNPGTPLWSAAAAVAGVVVAAATVLLPAWRSLRADSVAAVRAGADHDRLPLVLRLGGDVAALAAAFLVLRATSAAGYQLVLAPEGAPRIAVDYWAFAGPALLWVGAALLLWRLVELALRFGRVPLTRLLRGPAGPLAGTAAAGLRRRRRAVATAVTLIALAVGFAVAAAGFTATYRQQAEVDARLTNGADVTVTAADAGSDSSGDLAGAIAGTPGVRHVETIQHRFAYVGADLQDLYAVRPATVTAGAHLADGWFTGGTAAALMQRLDRQPDGVLVSAETVVDFQLQPGDRITLRVTDARTGAATPVDFHFLGVVNEFPTAPTDSFLVVNETYLTAKAGAGPGTHLVDTAGGDPAAVAAALRTRLGPGPAVTDITTSRALVGSSLTAVDLGGLTRIELGFALAIAAAAAGLVLAVDMAERRRTFSVAAALGARRRHLAGFVAGEAAVIVGPAVLAGVALGVGQALVLVATLNGVFDPPPDRLAVPWGYLAVVIGSGVAAAAATVAAVVARTRRPDLTLLREP
ncbi:ABC transporter permease [Dactylosporangium sp. NPDC006015]|uniref:ABC transporter permease n=1 Tax=Dactylosporangium sp. NPDC006015 TaxID=3154576 RepID=UPI0033AB7F9D